MVIRMLNNKAYAQIMRDIAKADINGILQVSTALWKGTADIIENSVEVVRCRDCKFALPYNDYYYCENEDSPFTNSDWAVCPNGDDFCSYGERRSE